MRRSADFGATVKQGRRAVQAAIVIYDRMPQNQATGSDAPTAVPPRVGLIIAKTVGSAVDRHRVARRLRHVVREVLGDLQPDEQLVIRALPASSGASSQTLRTQLQAGLNAIRRGSSAVR